MTRRPLSFLLASFVAIAACSGDEATSHGHTPHSVRVFDGATELVEPYQLSASQTLRLEVKFYAEDGDELVGLDADHVAGLTFAPTTLVTVAAVAGEPFQFDVTAQASAGSGTVTVGWGHDAPDALSFGPFDVDVQ